MQQGMIGGLWRDASPSPSLRNLPSRPLALGPYLRSAAALARTPRTGCLPCGEHRKRWRRRRRGPSLDLAGAAARRPVAPSLIMSSRSLARSPASYSAINGCFTYNTRRSRNYCQCSPTASFESLQVGRTILPRKLRKPMQWKTTFSTQRKIVPQCSSDLSTSCREEVPNYLAVNLLQDQLNARQGTTRKVLVILNPNSGFRSSRDVFYKKVQSTLKLSGFTMEVIETAYAGHAKAIASTVDLSKIPDGIICVGGDGIVNEVLNGLLGRDNWKEAIQLPIGIIPAGSDNSLVWTVLGIRDPVSAANALAKGGSTPLDVFSVKQIQAGFTHFGLTASYFGFVADVVQLSEDFRLQFGPFRYVVAGFLKFLSLPKYKFEVEYLPSSPGRGLELKPPTEKCHEQLSDCGKVMRVVQDNDGIQNNWVTRKGEFLGIFLCNHFCKPARGLLSPVIAPKAQPDDGNLDLILVRGSGRLRLFCFFIAYQLCWHLLLPFVEYVKVKQVKIRPVGNTHNGCGVDGELLCAEGQTEWQCSFLPAQGRLLGRHHRTLN